jgi:hypothetical protein
MKRVFEKGGPSQIPGKASSNFKFQVLGLFVTLPHRKLRFSAIEAPLTPTSHPPQNNKPPEPGGFTAIDTSHPPLLISATQDLLNSTTLLMCGR